MADDISIFVKVVGQKDIVATTNSLNKLEAGVKRLSNDLSKGRISNTQYTTGLRELRKGVDSSFGSWQKAKSAVDQYSKQVRQAQAIQKQAQAAIKAEAQALKEYRQARREATAENQRFDAEQRKAVKTVRDAANANRRLRMEFREGYAAKVQLRAAQMRLSQAMRKGIIDADQYEAQLEQLAVAQRDLANGAQAGGRRMSGMGMAIQQTGYQVGDFFVQIQGGTNMMVAFGQQATQLVGVLPMVATQLGLTVKAAIALSASLGIIIPIATAVGAWFMRTRAAAKEASEGVNTLEDSIRSLDQSLKDWLQTRKASQLGITIEELLGTQNIEKAESELDAAREALERLITSASVTPTGMFAGVAVIDFIKQRLAADEVTAAVLRLAQAEETLAILRQKQGEERFANYSSERVQLEEQLAMAQEIARFGEDSSQVARLELEQRIAAYDRNIDQLVKSNELNEIHARALKQINANIVETAAATEEINRNQDVLNETAKVFSNIWDSITGRIGESVDKIIDANTQLKILNSANRSSVTTYGGRGSGAEYNRPAPSGAFVPTQETLDAYNEMMGLSSKAASNAAGEIDALQQEIDKLNETASKGLTPFDKYNTAIDHLNTLLAEGLSDAAYSMEIERLNDELAKSLPLVDDVADAFGDFLARGLTDFKSFANSIFKSFQNMLAQMIASAARNRILISLGATGSMAGPASAASNLAQGAGMLGGVGTFASSIGTGLGVVGNGFMAGGFGGAATASMGAISGGLGAGGAMGLGTALGAAIPVLGAVALAVSFFRSKTKELDSGLNVTVKNMDALVESFKTVEKSRFFGLSKKTRTSTGGVSDAVSGPIVSAVEQIQQSVLTAAEAFGIGANAFDNFSYQFKLSLKGLSEEQQMQKINEELTKMGDSFASLTGHFSSMNELLEAAEQRYEIENRMLQALGNSSELLARSRERELAATHALNRGLLQATFDLEDANAGVASAIEGLRRAIDAEKQGLQDRASVINEALSQTKAVFDMLSNALKSRRLQDDASFRMRRSSAQSFLRAGDTSDTKALEEALGVVSEPSEGLFGSFVDYARDFLTTSRDIADLEKAAQVQLTIEEQMLAAIEAQLESLDVQYQTQIDQYNALLGIDTSVKSVEQAIASLKGAIEALASAQAAAKAAQAAGVGSAGGSGGGGSVKDVFGTGKKFQGFDLAQLRGSSDLLRAAQLAGVGTSGKTGAQISQEISNATGLAVNMDNATRAKAFARGGMHSGGMRLVGEEGPELEVTGPSRIYSAQQTKGMLQGGGDNAGLRAEVSELRSELRQLAIANNKYTKRSYDLFNKWDIDGLPATRT